MKQLTVLFLFISSLGFAQNFERIDNIVKSYPKYTKPEPLAQKISQDFQDDASRVRAAFRWLTYNIRYDLEEYFEPRKVIEFRYADEEERLQKLQAIKDNIVKEAFLTKMGVCEDYAQSFKKLADLMHIEAIVMKGYVRNSAYDIGRVPQTTNHAWNAVKIDNQWILLDATWASGYLFNGKWMKSFNEYYYAIDWKKVNRTHYPDHKRWQIILNSGSLEEFYNQPIYSNGLLRKNVEVLSPTKGNIEVNRTKKIVLKFKNLSPSDRLFYNYRGQRYAKRPEISFEGDVATVSLENPGANTELYFFIDKSLALEYKVFIQ
jgi:hypothetical protein